MPQTVSHTGLSPSLAFHSKNFRYDLKGFSIIHSVNAVGLCTKKSKLNLLAQKLSYFATPFITLAVKPYGYVKVWAVPISLATTFGIIGYSLFLNLLR